MRRRAKVGERCTNQTHPDVRVIDRSSVSITSCLQGDRPGGVNNL